MELKATRCRLPGKTYVEPPDEGNLGEFIHQWIEERHDFLTLEFGSATIVPHGNLFEACDICQRKASQCVAWQFSNNMFGLCPKLPISFLFQKTAALFYKYLASSSFRVLNRACLRSMQAPAPAHADCEPRGMGAGLAEGKADRR